MRTFFIGLLLAACAPPLGAQGSPSLGAGISREGLLRDDLEFGGREAIQARVDFEPGAIASRHSHPGAELVYVLSGTFEYRLDGQPPKTLKAGDVLFIPAGAVHAVENKGTGKASELATYIVDRAKPLIDLAE